MPESAVLTPPAPTRKVEPAPAPPAPSLDDPALYINRELSWLEFNRRVLAEAGDERVPLLERVKFLSIAASNLDEFLMVRVAAIRALQGPMQVVPEPYAQAAAEQVTNRLEVVCRHATPALYNAAEYRRIPFRFLWMPLAKLQEGMGELAGQDVSLSVIVKEVKTRKLPELEAPEGRRVRAPGALQQHQEDAMRSDGASQEGEEVRARGTG